MNVVIWARVSSREQKEGYSLDAQLRACRERAAKNGLTVVREFVVAESAKRGAERSAFNQMFKWVKAQAKKEQITAILSHKLDRVCRNMRDAVRLQELEDGCGVQLAFVDNQFGPGAAGALSFNVMAAVAQYYSDNLRSEVLKGMDEKVRQGWPMGHAPFGYLNVDNKDEPVIPHPERGTTLARIFELYATGRHTFASLADKLHSEGRLLRPSQPKFSRTSLSCILNNRFYVGELERNGKVYPGKYKLLINRRTFEHCQDILKGKNRRTGSPEIMLSGCILRCAVCGYAITGEHIRRKLVDGGRNVHLYYKCGNEHQAEDHPKVRWREEALEAAIVKDLDSMRIPSPEITDWLRDAITEAFADASYARTEWRKTLAKRKTELANMQDRLLNAYLGATVDEAVYNAKSQEFRREAEDVNRQMEEAGDLDPERGKLALTVFDFSQKLAEHWRGSKFDVRREILECVTSNRAISDTTLCLVKRKPFDFLAEQAFLKDGRGSWRNFEPSPQAIIPFLSPFLKPPDLHLLAIKRLVRVSA